MSVSSRPRLSVLLPTRNGGPFLKDCIASVLGQDHPNFELVISDNANTDETPEIILGHSSDPRVRASRQPNVLSVTDNWSAALKQSSGEYVLMMGDDDYLLPGALSRIDEVLLRHGDPECLLYNAYSYVAPDAIADRDGSYWSPRHYPYEGGFETETELSMELRMQIVRDMFRFRSRIPLNMQTTVFARAAIDRECDGVFRAPFPDHFLLNSLLIAGQGWAFVPDRLVIVGISPKSFGHYIYSDNSSAGLNYLGIGAQPPGVLPGNELLNGMYAWLLALKEAYPSQLAGISVDRAGYVRRQVYNWLRLFQARKLPGRTLLRRLASLSARDWLGLLAAVVDPNSWRGLAGLVSFRRGEAVPGELRRLPEVNSIGQFAVWLRQQGMRE